MKNKKIFLCILLGVLSFIIIGPNKVFADTDYLEITNLKFNGLVADVATNEVDGCLEFYYPDLTKLELLVTGSAGLDETHLFNFNLMKYNGGGYGNSSPGNMIKDGVQITWDPYDYPEPPTNNPFYPYIEATASEMTIIDGMYTKYRDLKMKIGDSYYESFKIYIVDPSVYDELDARFHEIAPTGVIEVDSIEPSLNHMESMIGASLTKYSTNKYTVSGWQDWLDNSKYYLSITKTDDTDISKRYPITFKFQEKDEIVAAKVDKYVDNFEEYAMNYGGPMGVIFKLEDLENINYLYTFIKHPVNDYMIKENAVINFSSQITSLIDHSNIELVLDLREGDGIAFGSSAKGFLTIKYNGVAYGVADEIGYSRSNIIYVPDDTEDTSDAYIKAAEDRIKAYLVGAEVKVTYAGQIADYGLSQSMIDGIGIDLSKTLGEYYKITLDGEENLFFIVKDSSKIQTPNMTTKDVKTDVMISSESSEVPIDSKTKVRILDKNSDEFKNLIKNFKILSGNAYDLQLLSESTNVYISKLTNGMFKVYIPLTSEMKNKKLVAYYLKDDGNVEEHEVTIEGDYAVFETDHFSTYTIGEPANANPSTGDIIVVYILMNIISMFALLLFAYKLKSYN